MKAWLSLTAACVLSGCVAGAGIAGAASDPSTSMNPPPMTMSTVISAALADAARRSGLPIASLRVDSAEAVTWRDGSLGCPQPGMAYTQALVPGFRVRIIAGGSVLLYHAGRSGAPNWCPPGRAQEPLSDDHRR